LQHHEISLTWSSENQIKLIFLNIFIVETWRNDSSSVQSQFPSHYIGLNITKGSGSSCANLNIFKRILIIRPFSSSNVHPNYLKIISSLKPGIYGLGWIIYNFNYALEISRALIHIMSNNRRFGIFPALIEKVRILQIF
jgi:hypothetical protein